MLIVVLSVALLGAGGVVRGAHSRSDSVERIAGMQGVLTPVDDGSPADGDATNDTVFETEVSYGARNYLVVGSDSRAGATGSGADADAIGDTSDVGGQRSDVMMVLRQEANGPASLLSIPRDLWVPISGTGKSNRINTALNKGPDAVAATVTDALGIPINHYIQVDFFGFKDIIDQIGGVEITLDHPVRDTHTGLNLPAGKQTLDGEQALAFARSRYFEYSDGVNWVSDPTGDKGRVLRQQFFIRAAVNGTLQTIRDDPFGAGRTLGAVIDSIKIDDSLDPIRAAQALRQAAGEGLTTYVLPTHDAKVGTAAVLKLNDDAEEVLAFFRGEGPPPVEFQTGSTNGDTGTPTEPAVTTATTTP